MLNALTVDVEDYFHVSAFSDVISPLQWDGLESRVEQNTLRLLELFESREIRATFFVLGWVASRSPALVRRIHDAGHEVACHGLSHKLVYTQTPDQFRAETRESKRILENLIGTEVIGYRAASYSITPKSLWALDILVEEGFSYDSSVFPIRHDRYGMPNASRKPGFMRTPNGASLLEFPLSTAKILGARLPVSGGGYFRIFPYWLTRAGLSSINRADGMPFIFYLHPWEIDYEQPRVRAGVVSTLRHYTGLRECESRLRQLLKEFQFGTVKAVLERQGLWPTPRGGSGL